MPASPADDEDNILDGGSTANVEDQDSGGNNQDANSAGSSDAGSQDAKSTPDIADAIKAALKGGKEGSSDSGESEGGTGEETDPNKAKKPEGEEEPLGELTDEELASYKGKTQRRMVHFRDQVKSLTSEISDLKPIADRYIAFDNWCKASYLTTEDINTGMNVMRLMKNEPIEAHKVLEPIFRQLEALVGVVLPEDLQQQVTSGTMTKEAAQELSRLRATTAVTKNTEMARTEKQKQDNTKANADAAAQFSADVGTATTKWENNWKASDPDYPLKATRVNEAIELELLRLQQANKLPTTVQGAIKMCEDVKKRVESEMKQFLPKKKALSPNPQVPGSTNGSKPRANSLQEAVSQAVGYR